MKKVIACPTNGKLYASAQSAAKDTHISIDRIYYALSHDKRWIDDYEFVLVDSFEDVATNFDKN